MAMRGGRASTRSAPIVPCYSLLLLTPIVLCYSLPLPTPLSPATACPTRPPCPLLQAQLAFSNDREDVVSLSLNAVQRLIDQQGLDRRGFLLGLCLSGRPQCSHL